MIVYTDQHMHRFQNKGIIKNTLGPSKLCLCQYYSMDAPHGR